MAFNKNWVTDLELNEEKIKSLEASLPEGRSLVVAVLENNLIGHDSYHNWAHSHYELPKLKKGYFTTNPPPEELIQRYVNIWPDHVVPIKEHEGVLYLACLEPLTDFQSPQPCQFVIAHFSDLHPHIKAIEAKNPKEPPSGLEFLDMGDNQPSSIDTVKPEGLDTQIVKKSLVDSVSNGLEPTTIHTQPNLEQPEALLTPESTPESPVEKLELLDEPADDTSKEEPAVEEISLDKAANIDDLNFGSPESLTPESPVDTPSTQEEPELLTPETIEPLQPIQPIEPIKSVDSKPELVKPELATPIAPKLETTNSSPFKEDTQPEEEFVSEVTAITRVDLQGPEGIAKLILNDLSNYYEKTMILLFNDGELSPWKWSGNWANTPAAGGKVASIDLKSPSVFKIVHSSRHPYHGYVVSSPTNDAFFKNWDEGQYPEHLTVLPMIVENNPIGMLLGTTTKIRGERIKLNRLTDLAKECANKLIQVKSAA